MYLESLIILIAIIRKIVPSNSMILYFLSCIIIFIILLVKIFKSQNKKFYIIVFLIFIFLFHRVLIFIKLLYYIACKNFYDTLAVNLFRDIGIEIRHNFDNLPSSPSIIMLNYPSDAYEYFINGIIPLKTCFVFVKGTKCLMNFIGRQDTIYVDKSKSGNLLLIQDRIKDIIKTHHILCYVETAGTKDKNSIGRIRSGMFRIAKNLSIPITPLFVGKIKHHLGVPIINHINIIVDDTYMVEDVDKSINHITYFYKNCLSK